MEMGGWGSEVEVGLWVGGGVVGRLVKRLDFGSDIARIVIV